MKTKFENTITFLCQRINRFHLVVFAFSFLPLFIYWLSFYPGIFTYDSHYVWSQLSTNNITDWHPAYYVILMLFLTKIWYSPGIITLFQILFFSLSLTYISIEIGKELNVSKWFTILSVFIISVNPMNGVLLVTVWKDVLYSISFVLFVFYLWRINNKGRSWISRNWFLFAIVSANVLLLRHNGIFPILLSFFIYLIFQRKHYKYLFLSLFTTILYIVLIKGPIYDLFQVREEITQPFSVVYLHPLAAHVVNHTEMTKTEEKILDEIHPINDWSYSCYDATVFLYRGFDVKILQEQSSFLLKTFLRFSISNPLVTLQHFACQSSFTWSPVQPQGVILETVYLNSSTDYLGWEKYADVVSPRSLLPFVRSTIERITNYWLRVDHLKITWRPSIYFFALIVLVIISCIKTKTPVHLLILTPVLFQTIGIAFTSQLQAVRYQYPIYLVSMFFSLPLLFWILTSKNHNTNKNEKQES